MNVKTFSMLIGIFLLPTLLYSQKRIDSFKEKRIHIPTKQEEKYVLPYKVFVRFDDKISKDLDVLMKANNDVNTLTKSAQDAFVRTGITNLDNVNKTMGAQGMRRVFRDAGKNEAKHRQAGLHLWYEINFEQKASTFDVQKYLNAYNDISEVRITEPAYRPELFGGGVLNTAPNDSLYSSQWHYGSVKIPQAWQLTTGDDRVIVSVHDQGVDFNHPDLVGSQWVNAGEIPNNGLDDDNNGYIDDVNGFNFADNTGVITPGWHGTHTGGTIGAVSNNGKGVAGIAGGNGVIRGVRLMSIEIFSSVTAAGYAEGFTYAADNGAVISQNSWGGGGVSAALENAIQYFIINAGGAGQAVDGGVVIFAAGNSNVEDPMSGYPASLSYVVAVGSTDADDKKSSFSNYGNWVDIMAPGNGVWSTTSSANVYAAGAGTSMACPHVSGVAALIASNKYGQLTGATLRGYIEGNTDNIDAANPTYLGKIGYGKLNAYKALTGIPLVITNYCETRGGNANYEWIENVTIGSILNNTSGKNYGYYYFSNPVQITAGATYTVQLTPGYSGTAYREGWAIYMDFNNDKDFDDNGELVFSAPAANTTQAGSITLPAIIPSTFRMRVSMKYNGVSTPCELFSYGEVEDYMMVSSQGATCDIPTNIQATNISYNSANVSWGAVSSATSYNIRYKKTNEPSWLNIPSISNTNIVLSNLGDTTQYEMQVSANCSGGSSDFSPSVLFTTHKAPIIYPPSQATKSTYFWINQVGIDGQNMNNSTSNNGYGDYVSVILGSLSRGNAATLKVRAGYSNYLYRVYWKVWIDFNQDGDFNDEGECVSSGATKTPNVIDAAGKIPQNANLGKTRLRISMKYCAFANPDEAFQHGEVEDYTVDITN